jgi:hypothetical protein
MEMLIKIDKYDRGGREELKRNVSVCALCMSGVKVTDLCAMRCISCEHELYGMSARRLTPLSMIRTTKLLIITMPFSKLLRLCKYYRPMLRITCLTDSHIHFLRIYFSQVEIN